MRHDFGVPKSHSPTCSLSFSHASHQDLGPLFLFCKFCFLIKKNLSTLCSELSWYYLSSIPPVWCLRHHLVPYLETSTLLPGTSQFVSLCTLFFICSQPICHCKGTWCSLPAVMPADNHVDFSSAGTACTICGSRLTECFGLTSYSDHHL